MKKSFFLTLLLALVLIPVLSAQNSDLAKAQHTVTRFFDALAALDTETMENCVTSDFVLLENAEKMNMDSLQEETEKLRGVDFIRKNRIEFFDSGKRGDVIWLSYFNTAMIVFGEQNIELKWVESSVLVKEGDIWKIRLMHVTERNPE